MTAVLPLFDRPKVPDSHFLSHPSMQMYWIYDMPNAALGLLIIGGIVVAAIVGLIATRPLARRFFGPPPGHNEFVGDLLQVAGSFYGITLGLIAVGAWSASGDADSKVGREAAELAGLYRDCSCMPEREGTREDLQDILRRYTRYVIDEAWPQQRAGKLATGGVAHMAEFTTRMKKFKAADPSEQVFMAEVFAQFNRLYEARRLRLESVDSGMPAVLWGVVFAGAGITISLMYCFVMEKTRVHCLFVGLISALLALLIFITAAMDNPFHGNFSVSPEPYELTYQQLMKVGEGEGLSGGTTH